MLVPLKSAGIIGLLEILLQVDPTGPLSNLKHLLFSAEGMRNIKHWFTIYWYIPSVVGTGFFAFLVNHDTFKIFLLIRTSSLISLSSSFCCQSVTTRNSTSAMLLFCDIIKYVQCSLSFSQLKSSSSFLCSNQNQN